MGLSFNIDVSNENEFNQQLQMYLAQGYSMQSNVNGVAILKKKSYSVGLLIVLIIFFFPAAILYYLLASDDIVTIKQTGAGHSASSDGQFTAFCDDCGHGLLENSKFCPGCGKDLSEVAEKDVPTCGNCGGEILADAKFCPHCGEDLSKSEEDSSGNPRVCESCGTEIVEGGKFCPECGEEVKE